MRIVESSQASGSPSIERQLWQRAVGQPRGAGTGKELIRKLHSCAIAGVYLHPALLAGFYGILQAEELAENDPHDVATLSFATLG
jgi:hypothetical protein